MSKNNIVIASTVALGALSGCEHYTHTPQGVFQNEIIKTDIVRDGPNHGIQWLSHGDSTSVTPVCATSKIKPELNKYYVASGAVESDGYVMFTDLKELTKQQADSMRKTITYQEAVDASRKASAAKDSVQSK